MGECLPRGLPDAAGWSEHARLPTGGLVVKDGRRTVAAWTILLASCSGTQSPAPAAPEEAQPRATAGTDGICNVGDAAACERAGDDRAGAHDFSSANTYYETACK